MLPKVNLYFSKDNTFLNNPNYIQSVKEINNIVYYVALSKEKKKINSINNPKKTSLYNIELNNIYTNEKVYKSYDNLEMAINNIIQIIETPYKKELLNKLNSKKSLINTYNIAFNTYNDWLKIEKILNVFSKSTSLKYNILTITNATVNITLTHNFKNSNTLTDLFSSKCLNIDHVLNNIVLIEGCSIN